MKRPYLYRWAIGIVVTGMLAAGGCGKEAKEEGDIVESTGQERETVYDKETNSLETWKQELEPGAETAISSAAIRGIETVKNGETILAVSYEPRTYKNSYDCWSLSVPYESWASVDTEAMYEYFDYVEALDLEKAEISEADAGLSDSNTSMFVAYYSGQEEENPGQAEPDKGVTFWFGKETEDGRCYIKTSSGNDIWTGDKNTVEGLLEPKTYDMVLKIANVVSIETVSSVEIQIGEEDYTIDLSKQEEGTYKLNGKKADKDEINSLYTDLISIFIEKEIQTGEERQEESLPMMRITYYRNIEDAPEIVESFYGYDNDYAAVNINGTEFFLADKSAVEELIDSVENAF